MKRILTCALALLLVCSLLIPAVLADVIFEPDDSFYEKNRDECQYHGRNYLVNSPEGGVRVMKSPTSKTEVMTLENGTEINIYYIWDGKNSWGYLTGWEEGTEKGWVDMASLTLVYDNTSFLREHEAEFFDDEDEINAFFDRVTQEDELQIYSYPNSGEVSSTLPVKWIENKENLNFRDLYRDEDGKIWGYVGYFKGHRDWICLTDPLNPELPATGRPEIELYPAAQLPPKSGLTNPTIAGILVAAAAAISVVLLKRKRK